MSRFGYKERLAQSLGYRVDGLSVAGPRGRVVPWVSNTGYPYITLGVKRGKCSVHRLVAFQKWGDMIYQEGMEARHLDGDKLNFLPDNIALGTHSENIMDIPAVRRSAIASYAASFRRLHDRQAVCDFYATNRSYRKTMQRFGLTSKGTLHYILNGRTPINPHPQAG